MEAGEEIRIGDLVWGDEVRLRNSTGLTSVKDDIFSRIVSPQKDVLEA